MEYLAGGSLSDFLCKIYKAGNILGSYEASKIIKQILRAVSYIHNFNIVHRDLKPGINHNDLENIMFERKNDINTLKLIDFGLSTKYDQCTTLFERCGTGIYMAPEIVLNQKYDKVWIL